jgi:transposase
MHSTTLAVDLAKSVFAVAVSSRPGHIERQLRLTRARFLEFMARHQPAVVVLEACGSAHYWSRQLAAFGHTPVLLPAQYVRPYVRRNKTDDTDAAALLEAYRNDQIRPVAVKSVEQQALVALHRLRSAWMATRTARLNALRGFLRELGLTIPVGARHVLPRLTALLAEDPSPVPASLHSPLLETAAEIRDLERRIRDLEGQLQRQARALPAVHRHRTVPGIGLLTSTALFALGGDLRRFRSGRHFASFLGLTPRERSSGHRRHLGAISKRGDAYLRTLFIHGARSVLSAAKHKKQPDRLRAWALRLERTAGHNRAAVALANKLARIAWAVSTRERDFETYPLPVAA